MIYSKENIPRHNLTVNNFFKNLVLDRPEIIFRIIYINNWFLDFHLLSSKKPNFLLPTNMILKAPMKSNSWLINGDSYQDIFKIKIDLPSFDGNLDLEDLLDWLKKVDNYFDYTQTPEQNKTKLVAYKFQGGASAWWDQEQSNRRRMGKQ